MDVDTNLSIALALCLDENLSHSDLTPIDEQYIYCLLHRYHFWFLPIYHRV